VAAFRLESMAWLAMVAVKVDAEPFARTFAAALSWLNLLVWWPFLGATWKVPCLKLDPRNF